MSRRRFTFWEFFAGGGMARLGLGPAWRPLLASDFDPAKAASYRANFGDGELDEADIWDLAAADVPGQADLAWASSPCQDFSLAGARAGLSGARSSALMGFWRLMAALAGEGRAPRLIVIENVAGLTSSRGGADLAAIAELAGELGYATTSAVIDAAAFVPQSRRRLLIVAHRGGPLGIPAPPPHRDAVLSDVLEPDDAVRWHGEAQTRALVDLMDGRNRAKVRAALTSSGRRVGAVFRRVRPSGQRAEVRFDGLAGCLRTPVGGSSRQMLLVVEGGAVRSRLLSPREAARLMGLPENYILPEAANAALHLAGDGVVVPMVRWLAATVLEPALTAAPGVRARPSLSPGERCMEHRCRPRPNTTPAD